MEFQLLLLFTLLLILLGILELLLHKRNLRRIPIRIHVNGTRGKSSVVRLITAGLRADGRRCCGKTTGTTARMILPDGRETPVFRPSRANVSEQLRIVRAAARLEAEVLVVECMALQPQLQWLSESRFIQATHGVITNTRPDHLDVMGPGIQDVAQALAGMIPPKGLLYTAESLFRPLLAEAAGDRSCRLIPVEQEEWEALSESDMAGFSYKEHPENVALALRICKDLGVQREQALLGMWAASPDPGAMTEHRIDFFGREILFINGFAANDPDSTEQIWEQALQRHPQLERRIALFNCRADRGARSRQLGAACVAWTAPDEILLMGTGTYALSRTATKLGLPSGKIHSAEGCRVEEVFERLLALAGRKTLIMGMGNIGGQGLELLRYFKNRELL